jgi:hypothetical protein
MLWVLDEFCNTNKHRRLLLTGIRAASVPGFETREINGKLWANVDLPRVDKDATIGPFPIVGSEVQMEGPIVAYIAFDEGPTGDEEVSRVLNETLNFLIAGVFQGSRGFSNGDSTWAQLRVYLSCAAQSQNACWGSDASRPNSATGL